MKTTYSRRELYAAGEPLGNSATYKKASGGYVLGGGGGSPPPPPPAPTSQTVMQTNIPEYARPYVETMLGATQQQLFNTQTNPETGAIEITGIKPYVPYSQDPTAYIAGFSPLQQQAQQTTAALQVPGQYQTATDIAGLGALSALGAGGEYQRMATSPYAMQAYMSPYVSASLAPQLAEIQRQADIQQTQQQGAATRAGAFGGSREALMGAEAQRAGLMAKQQAIGQAYDKAYQQAQQAQQFGAQLGLQGLGQAIGGAGQLAGIGGQQFGTAANIIGLQSQAGAQQQQQQQNIINQAVQNYAMAQQYPLQSLAFMNAQLRGLPLQQTTTQAYQAQPGTAQQAIGLGLAGLGAYKAFGS